MADREKVNETAERFAQATVGQYRMLVGYAAGVQARNLRFVQNVFAGTTAETRRQAEANRAMAQGLAERAGEGGDAFRRLVEGSFDAYRTALYAPFSHGDEGPRQVAATDVPGGGGLPIEGYDELSVKRVSERLDNLSAGELEAVRVYEEQNKNRGSLLKQIERRTKAASS